MSVQQVTSFIDKNCNIYINDVFHSKTMLSLLWGIVVVLVAFWALGLALHILGNLIHIVLLIAIGLAVYNFIKSRTPPSQY